VEGKRIGAVTIVSDCSRNPKKKVTLVKLYASGLYGRKLCGMKDDAIDKILTTDAKTGISLVDTSLGPTFRYIQRWYEAIPEFNQGHFKRLYDFKNGKIEQENDKIAFAGDYLGGPFIEGAFTSGINAAERLHKKIKVVTSVLYKQR